MSDTLTELATFLTNAGLSNVKKGQMPPNPNSVVCVYEYGGLPPENVFGQSAIELEHPRIQVAIRGEPGDYATPRATAETAYRAMAAAGAQSISSTRYLAMEPLQSPFPIMKDDNNRMVLAFNVQVTKQLSA